MNPSTNFTTKMEETMNTITKVMITLVSNQYSTLMRVQERTVFQSRYLKTCTNFNLRHFYLTFERLFIQLSMPLVPQEMSSIRQRAYMFRMMRQVGVQQMKETAPKVISTKSWNFLCMIVYKMVGTRCNVSIIKTEYFRKLLRLLSNLLIQLMLQARTTYTTIAKIPSNVEHAQISREKCILL